uniref:protein acetyllysine N-acetyltransferase n=1 Tax=Acrobeloides nanus TaxID=290746 RepID=A0A914E5H3_9BILA
MARIDNKARLSENVDSPEVLEEKCLKLVELIKNARCTIVYTGAGISTAASIPDYRGPSGLWTLARQGKIPSTSVNPIASSPTTAHIVLKELCRNGWVRHVVSQNCDGLHLRSGIPRHMLSEIHGNTTIEVCSNCDKEYIRNFDVTVNSGFE